MESKNYGLPLIFKVVNRKNGKEVHFEKCKGRVFCIWLLGKLLELAIPRTEGKDDFELLQQTGFTDAAGKDVYFGDVLATNKVFRVIHREKDQLAFGIVQFADGDIQAVTKCSKYKCASGVFNSFYIVGNCYESPSRWLERAREIWPGAELPEGVRG